VGEEEGEGEGEAEAEAEAEGEDHMEGNEWSRERKGSGSKTAAVESTTCVQMDDGVLAVCTPVPVLDLLGSAYLRSKLLELWPCPASTWP
jgi:hypothetical protein